MLSESEQRFAEMYLATGDAELAYASVFGEPDSLTFALAAAAAALLQRPAIQDYLVVMRRGNTDDVEDTIEKLEAFRREHWRRGNVAGSQSAQMDIARMRGWLVQRIEQKIEQNVTSKNVTNLPTRALLDVLSTPKAQALLAERGYALRDGELCRAEGKLIDNDTGDILHDGYLPVGGDEEDEGDE